jgi:hypothetical protein
MADEPVFIFLDGGTAALLSVGKSKLDKELKKAEKEAR